MPTTNISRRTFLKMGATGAAAVVLAGCMPPRQPVTLEPYVKAPEEQLTGQATWYATTCRQCPAGCGIVVRVMNGRAVKIEGNAEHPLNLGKVCARGQAGLQLLYNPDRLTGPAQQAQRGSRSFAALAWNDAINLLYSKVQAAGNQVAIWGGSTLSGHLYDLFQRFTHALNAPAPLIYDLYAELQGYQAFSQANQQVYGSPELPSYSVGQADVILSFGADFLGTGLSATRYGIEFGNFRSQGQTRRTYLVQMEPRMSITAAKADRWLPIVPGTEALVAQAILRLMADQDFGAADRKARAQVVANEVDINNLASACGISVDEFTRLARLFATAQQPLALPGQPLAGQNDGATALATVQALNWVAGAAGTLSLTPPTPVSQFVKPASTTLADAKALLQRMQAGQVQVLLVHSANPAYDLPPDAGFADAVKKVPFVVSFSPLVDETAASADLILPDRTYLEAWGYEVVAPNFGQPVVSSQQPVVVPVFDARATGDIVLALARGIPSAAAALPWNDEVAFLQDAVSHLPAGNQGGPAEAWTRFVQHGGWWPTTPPPTAVPTGKPAQAFPVILPQAQGAANDYPYFLHLYPSGLLGEGRGANLPWLQGSPDPMTTIAWQTWAELHPSTAQKLGVSDGDIVRVTSPYGEVDALVCTYPGIRPDTVAIPFGQGHSDYGRYARGRGSNPLRLLTAQAQASAKNLVWTNLRVKVTATGQKAWLAVFEDKAGVAAGFINQALPGK